MRDNLTRGLGRLQRTFATFTTGQKVVAVIGTLALVLAGGMVFRWAATPSYTALYGNLSSSDASAVIEQLDTQGVPYRLANGGETILVPQDKVYATRIALSGEGLPTGSDGAGYSLLDSQDLSTSQFKEQTNFKRAMEGELARTITAIDGVQSAVVHLALPAKQVFAEKQDPATASVLVKTRTGQTLRPEQVQAVVNLVAASIDGLDTEEVTVADASGKVLSTNDGSGGGAGTRTQQVEEYQAQLNRQIQTMLDRVVGGGNSTVHVTADLSFDKAVSESTTFTDGVKTPLSAATSEESYDGPAGTGLTGVVGPDGQMDGLGEAAGGASKYAKKAQTRDNAVNKVVEQRETAPGGVDSLHVGVVIDSMAAPAIEPAEIRNLISAAVGIDANRGDTVRVSSMPFDRSAEEAAAAELEAAEQAAKNSARNALYRNITLAVLILLLLLAAWLRNRRRSRAREEATSYVVEQLRRDAAARAQAETALEQSPALVALESAEHDVTDEVREEIAALVERQPDDVAALLRGWLVERP
ncbi:flagellar basal-body MS-ring/collar protein FliF [Nocardioides sp.]|uniref:flagellar basal-body MS-ring/collar protein FliF n=1 Tax=Nocardioides sp. TaxID=35761 RepID=UPI002734577C|nr:flagellar basal-body MS-ring/collar protein FliF [Nocardioides sp.]MDP3890241.1 flagellar basal-body MS-ring/collar protein FliF [Nocardioides sp.]